MKKTFTFTFLLFISISCIQAQKISAADMYYKLIGPKKYLVTAHVYRVCEMAALKQLTAYVYGDTMKVPMSFTRISIEKINDTCGNPCQNQNAVSNPGYEKHVFVDTIDFNSSPYDVFASRNICMVRFGISQNLRLATVTTHSIGNFFLDAAVNICLNISKNSSPIFSVEPKMLMACNQPTSYTPGPLDTMDYDSIAFELDAAQLDEKTSVTYSGSYTKALFMSPYCPPNPGVVNCRALPNAKPPRGVYFDGDRCEFTVTPVKCDEVASARFRISEYRRNTSTGKMELLGYVCREMTIQVKQYPENNPPTFVGSNQYSVCQGNKLCLNIQTKDYPFLPKQTTSDTTTLTWNYGIPATSGFTIIDPAAREKEAQMCWTIKPNTKPGTYYFATIAYDQVCNINLASKAFAINLKPRASDRRSYTVLSSCNQVSAEAFPNDSVYFLPKDYTFRYIVREASNMGTVLFNSYKRLDTFTFSHSGTYIIEHQINHPSVNCPGIYFDTVSVAPPKGMLNFNRDTLLCNMDSFTFGPQNLVDNPAFRYQWENPAGALNPGDTFRIIKVKPSRHPVILTVTDKRNCILKDTIVIGLKGMFDFNFEQAVNKVCINLATDISAKHIRAEKPYNIEWRINGQTSSITDTFINESFSKTSVVQLTISDQNNCSYTDSIVMIPVDYPLVKLGKDSTVCLNTTLNIISRITDNNKPLVYTWFADGVKLSAHDSFLKYQFNKSRLIRLEVTNATGCSSQDGMLISTFPFLDFNIVSKTNYHPSNRIVLSTDIAGKAYQWFNNRTGRQDSFQAADLGKPGTYKVWCKMTDSNGCKVSDTITVHTDQFLGIDPARQTFISIYPNPVSDQLSMDTREEGLVEIISMDGRILISQYVESGVHTMRMTGLLPGMYMLRFKDQTRILVKQ